MCYSHYDDNIKASRATFIAHKRQNCCYWKFADNIVHHHDEEQNEEEESDTYQDQIALGTNLWIGQVN